MEDIDKFAVFFMILMLLYTWMKAREKTHNTIRNKFLEFTESEKKEEMNSLKCESSNVVKDDNDIDSDSVDETSLSQKKIDILLFSVHLSVDLLSTNIFMLALFLMIVLQIFQFTLNKIKDESLIQLLSKDMFNKLDVFGLKKRADRSRKKRDDEINSIAKSAREERYNMNENEENEEIKEIGEDSTGIQKEKKMSLSEKLLGDNRYFTNKLVNDDTLGNKRVFDIIYEFSMSMRIMILTYLFNYGFTQMYTYFIVKRDGVLTEDAIHMHADIILFVVFINFVILIYLSV